MSSNESSTSLASPQSITLLQPTASYEERAVPSLCGLPLKYVSLVTLAVQNAALTIIMHTSRISTPPSQQYSAASAVLLNELLKGSISLAIAISRVEPPRGIQLSRVRRIARDVFSPDCWKLSIPAILYVIQNNLQYVAASNLDAATFQVTYQMKILTTAGFSVLLLRKQLSSIKWLALLLLGVGVGIVQIQGGGGKSRNADTHTMNPLIGFLAVTAACFTSGLAGVYFEMVLKNSPADLWVRNVQLSLFSLLPALLPALLSDTGAPFPASLFRHFGVWAWATVLTQVLGGLITAVVIKHADNILKGFATSLSIVISFVASVILFDFSVTPVFVLGACVVLGATFLYNQPAPEAVQERNALGLTVNLSRSKPCSTLGSPVESTAPILGQTSPTEKRRASLVTTLAALSGFSPRPDEPNELIMHPLYTPPASRPPSPLPPPSPSRLSVVSGSSSSSGAGGPHSSSRQASGQDVGVTR